MPENDFKKLERICKYKSLFPWCPDIQHNGIWSNDISDNYNHHNDFKRDNFHQNDSPK